LMRLRCILLLLLLTGNRLRGHPKLMRLAWLLLLLLLLLLQMLLLMLLVQARLCYRGHPELLLVARLLLAKMLCGSVGHPGQPALPYSLLLPLHCVRDDAGQSRLLLRLLLLLLLQRCLHSTQCRT